MKFWVNYEQIVRNFYPKRSIHKKSEQKICIYPLVGKVCKQDVNSWKQNSLPRVAINFAEIVDLFSHFPGFPVGHGIEKLLEQRDHHRTYPHHLCLLLWTFFALLCQLLTTVITAKAGDFLSWATIDTWEGFECPLWEEVNRQDFVC